MSNAISQNATNLAVSGNTEENFSFEACAKRNAERTAKGSTRERQFLQYNKLITACCADYRSHFPMIYGKSERLPSAVFEKIDKAVTKYIQYHLNRVNVQNAISFRRGFYHNQKQMEVTDRVTAVGENKLPLAEQHLGINIMIHDANKRLDDLMKKPTPDHDREKEMRATIMRLELTKSFIEGEQEHQKKVAEEAKQ
jgi:hypothetical protein